MGNNPSRSSSSNPQSPASATSSHFGGFPHQLRSGTGVGGGGGGGIGPGGNASGTLGGAAAATAAAAAGGGVVGGGYVGFGHERKNSREPRRRGSIQALTAKSVAAAPSAVLEATTAHSFATPRPRPTSRGRSHTTTSSTASSSSTHNAHTVHTVNPPSHALLFAPAAPPFLSASAASAATAATVAAAAAGVAPPSSTSPFATLPADFSSRDMGTEQSKPKAHDKHQQASREGTPPVRPSPLSKPVAVPAVSEEHANANANANATTALSSPPLPEHFSLPTPAQFSRPPRLPLPIEEEIHTPGSPIISPAEIGVPLDAADVDGILPRRTSVLSSTTVDDDDGLDDFNMSDGEIRPTVPTIIEWRGPGEKVYVTGTFAGWDRKYRLHKDGPSPHKDALSATIPLLPGTHHLKFIVDGDMCLSDKLPTAVDFTNILVNYIEVSPDQLSQTPADPESDANKVVPPSTEALTPRVEIEQAPSVDGLHPPQALPPTPEIKPVTAPSTTTSAIPEAPPDGSQPTAIVPVPSKEYYTEIPKFLTDLDAPEGSTSFARANAALEHLPAPPTLPMFLSRSILNGATPMKDDASVLNLPNHTVLNHLATSSIRSNVLATSATTRYKRKFLTTIMYKPTTELGE